MRIDFQFDLIAVSQTVAIGIRVPWIASARDFITVRSCIAIHIRIARVGLVGLNFVAVQQLVIVRIGVERIGRMRLDLLPVQQLITPYPA